ncbi:hypothetical protein [Yoonia sp. 208BN28-4]|uniref:hypothetical protein n=1 Tax=Yoonia sp. 208BN28-4 TaxID=3126505 RepID=UPI0030A5B3D3
MEKQPVQTACFEEVFLDYLRLRFEFEPLPHYVMAAIHVCDQSSRSYPQFVFGFLAWFADGFLFEREGTFPAQSHNKDPADKRWRRYRDCQALLDGWLNDDLTAALEAQEERLELVERVAALRLEERKGSHTSSGRKHSKMTKTETEIFDELEEYYGDIAAYTLKRQHKKLTEHREYMSGVCPVAIVPSSNGFEIKIMEIDEGVFRLLTRAAHS